MGSRAVLLVFGLIGSAFATAGAQIVVPDVLEFGTIPANSNTGAHYSRALSIHNNLDGEYLTLSSFDNRPPFEHGSGIVEPTELLPVIIAPGDSIGFSYLLMVAARTQFDYRDTVRFVLRRGERPVTDTLLVPVAATLAMSNEPFGTSRVKATYSYCRCASYRPDGIPKTIAVGGLFLVNPGTDDLTLDSFRVTGSPGVVVNDSIRVFDAVWLGSGPLPPSRFRRTPVQIVAGTTANVIFEFLAVPAGPKEARVTFYLRRPSGDTLTVTSIGSGSVIERNSVLAPLREFPLSGANRARVPVGRVDSTSLNLALYTCTVPGDADVTVESVTFRRPGLLSLLSRRPSEPMRPLPLTLADCAGKVAEALDTNLIEYRLRFAPTEPGVVLDTAVITYSYPTALGIVRDSTYAVYFLEALPSSAVRGDEARPARLTAIPNPVGGTVRLEGVAAVPGAPVVVAIVDAAGRATTSIPSAVDADRSIVIQLPELPAGTYTLVLTGSDGSLGSTRVLVAP